MGWLCVPFHCFSADSWHGLVSDCVQPTTDHRAADPRLQRICKIYAMHAHRYRPELKIKSPHTDTGIGRKYN